MLPALYSRRPCLMFFLSLSNILSSQCKLQLHLPVDLCALFYVKRTKPAIICLCRMWCRCVFSFNYLLGGKIAERFLHNWATYPVSFTVWCSVEVQACNAWETHTFSSRVSRFWNIFFTYRHLHWASGRHSSLIGRRWGRILRTRKLELSPKCWFSSGLCWLKRVGERLLKLPKEEPKAKVVFPRLPILRCPFFTASVSTWDILSSI